VAAAEFYTAFARLYDRLARAPGVGRVRRRVARALAPSPGATVLDLGCGTGANAAPLCRAVGSDGGYVGVDFAPGVLRVARRRVRRRRPAWRDRATFLRGDATRPPVAAERVDAACATFLVGMLGEPAAAVRTWGRLVGTGGRLALANLERTTDSLATALNPLFRLGVRAGAPGSAGGSAVERLERRVTAAHGELDRITTATVRNRGAGGFLRVTAGSVQPPSAWSTTDE